MDSKTVTLTFTDGKSAQFTIAQMPVARFRTAWKAVRPELDELKLLDCAFNQHDGWSVSLTPESYTVAADAMYALNPDFFGSVARRQAFASASGSLT